MSSGDDIDHLEMLGHVSAVEKHPGMALFEAEFKSLKDAMLDEMMRGVVKDDELAKHRHAMRVVTEKFSPAAIIESLKTKHRSGAEKDMPRVPRT